MRGSRGGSVLLTGDGQLIGFALGADYCAEHEWGIKGLQEAFGLRQYERTDDTAAGLARRTVTKVPAAGYSALKLIDTKHFTALVYGGSYHLEEISGARDASKAMGTIRSYEILKGMKLRKTDYGHDIPEDKREDFAAAWSEKDFAIIAADATVREHLRALHKAMLEKNAAIWLGGGGVFENPGLVLAIAGNVTEEQQNTMRAAELETVQLYREAEATGIYKKIDKSMYFALTPRRDQKGGLMFWLNPRDQQKYNHGWFTVAQLEQWLKGTGPVIMKKGKT